MICGIQVARNEKTCNIAAMCAAAALTAAERNKNNDGQLLLQLLLLLMLFFGRVKCSQRDERKRQTHKVKYEAHCEEEAGEEEKRKRERPSEEATCSEVTRYSNTHINTASHSF